MRIIIDEGELTEYVTQVVSNLYRIDFKKDTSEQMIQKVLLKQGALEVIPTVIRYLKDEDK
jgi:hypothetical protein